MRKGMDIGKKNITWSRKKRKNGYKGEERRGTIKKTESRGSMRKGMNIGKKNITWSHMKRKRGHKSGKKRGTIKKTETGEGA